MLVLNRRDWLCSTMVSHVMDCQGTRSSLSLEECADIICKETPRDLRQAVKDTNRVLFRGEAVEKASILSLVPDLLDPGTYNDPEALAYFSCMESFLNESNVLVKPSNGHIATSSIEDAVPWGNPVSIWPLGNRWSYVWAEDRKLLYPGYCVDNQDHSLVFNDRLSVALQMGSEVLFSTADSTTPRSQVLAAPSGLTMKLMALLNDNQYGL